jgi:hypothetical protein
MFQYPCDRFAFDLFRVRVGAGRETVAHEKFIAVCAFAKHNFSSYRMQSLHGRQLPNRRSLILLHFCVCEIRASSQVFANETFRKSLTNEDESYTKVDGVVRAACFNFGGFMQPTFDEFFCRNLWCIKLRRP